ncbi:MAG: DUF4388 domain-containing protein [Thermoanaerobaculia bacterium]
MAVTGNLSSMTPGDLLQWLSLGQKTGTLVLSRGSVQKKVYFRKGRVISSASNDPREYLGQFLISHGFLTEPELKKAMEVQVSSGILIGKILVMIEVISEKDLLRLMRLKAEEEIYDIFLWKEGEFHFLDDELPEQQLIPLQVDVTGIIMEGTRRVDEWSRIREVVTDEAQVPVMVKTLPPTSDLDEAQRTVVQAIDGKRTIAEIVLESRSSSFLVASTVHSLVREGFVTLQDLPVVKAAVVKKEIDPQTVSGPIQAVFENEDEEISSFLMRAQVALKGRDYEKSMRLLKAAQNLDPNHPKVRTAVKGAESVIMNELRSAGVSESKVPRVAKEIEEITTMNFTPNEGFILSRINGTWDIGSLVKISPIREPDALLIFYKLWKDGIIALD